LGVVFGCGTDRDGDDDRRAEEPSSPQLAEQPAPDLTVFATPPPPPVPASAQLEGMWRFHHDHVSGPIERAMWIQPGTLTWYFGGIEGRTETFRVVDETEHEVVIELGLDDALRLMRWSFTADGDLYDPIVPQVRYHRVEDWPPDADEDGDASPE